MPAMNTPATSNDGLPLCHPLHELAAPPARPSHKGQVEGVVKLTDAMERADTLP